MFCLGNCALGPSGTLDGALHARLTPDRLDALDPGVGPMSPTVWVPCDAAAVSVGADAVAAALEAAGATVRRNGSRGMLWLEPLVEVETERGRVGYANVEPGRGRRLLDGDLDDTDRGIGVVDEHPWLARQHRVSLRPRRRHRAHDLAAYRGTAAWPASSAP